MVTKQISIVWSTEDVQEVRPDLSEEQCGEVLDFVKKNHDACWGVCWETLRVAAQYLFPEDE